MAIFNGRYSWTGKRTDDQQPIAWSPGAYDVQIYKRDSQSKNIELLKPYVCIYSRTGKGQSISVNPEKFAKQLCHEFSLHIERVFWVEDLLGDEDRYEVVQFCRSGRVGKTIFYTIEKRKATSQEIELLKKERGSLAQS
jgi:hypothetical protein